MSAVGTYTPSVTGEYVIGVAADDEASFSIGSCGVSVTWPVNHGQFVQNTCHLVAGQTYPINIQYANSAGGAYFLSTSFSGPEGSGQPHLQVTPTQIRYNIYDDGNLSGLAPEVSIIGTFDPNVNYSVAVNIEAGLQSATSNSDPDSPSVGLLVYPMRDPSFWHEGTQATAIFQLYADGDLIDEKSCTFEGVSDVPGWRNGPNQ